MQQVNHGICSDASFRFHDFKWNVMWTWRLTVFGFLADLYYTCLCDWVEVSLLNLRWVDNWCAIEQAAEVLLPFIELV